METLIVIIFILGYSAIAFEQFVRINKAASALVTGVLCWTVYILSSANKQDVIMQLDHHMGSLSGILFFLMCAMTIVELVDAHNGFEFITARITQTNKIKLIWLLGFITFFLSAVLDNLTTTIVIVSLIRKLIPESKDRLFFAGITVIAANAGGAWTPIGDVTTTMRWIGGQISTWNIIIRLFIPSMISLIVPLVIVSFMINGTILKDEPDIETKKVRDDLSRIHQFIVFSSGILMLILIPVFKTLTHLPPYMGALIALGLLWVITGFIHDKMDEQIKKKLSLSSALKKIDSPTILFFLGILLSVASLGSIGLLPKLASWITATIINENIVLFLLGLISAVIDNVPLVAAVQGMYSLDQYPLNHNFWLLLAYCAGTGGSILIIGSAAGVAAMGMEKINFFWYLKKISFLALLGYFAGIITFMLQQYLLT